MFATNLSLLAIMLPCWIMSDSWPYIKAAFPAPASRAILQSKEKHAARLYGTAPEVIRDVE